MLVWVLPIPNHAHFTGGKNENKRNHFDRCFANEHFRYGRVQPPVATSEAERIRRRNGKAEPVLHRPGVAENRRKEVKSKRGNQIVPEQPCNHPQGGCSGTQTAAWE